MSPATNPPNRNHHSHRGPQDPSAGPASRGIRPRRNLRQVGKAGEDEAAAYLVDRGYRLLDRNFFTARGEVDIVLAGGDGDNDDTIVFVEVKWRLDGRYGSGAEAVTPAKLAAMRHAGAEWLRRNPNHRAPVVRFDVLDITAGDITHYEGVGW
ncbi:YraN family protein [Corynebacterium glyciniphilum]|uniref:YraN family protein n=1 Tax=Corynebacterium glyciniphilum TaxID=1404244 RepID=UPI0026531DFF|nr:YraN family protein [Corynebacterium glyciniphilum]MDN5683474.1 YraN family protein [Corynebacterium glyciniphilum]MDN6707202.1 YraN family protein [Corynebacterium glyciniphilum]